MQLNAWQPKSGEEQKIIEGAVDAWRQGTAAKSSTETAKKLAGSVLTQSADKKPSPAKKGRGK